MDAAISVPQLKAFWQVDSHGAERFWIVVCVDPNSIELDVILVLKADVSEWSVLTVLLLREIYSSAWFRKPLSQCFFGSISAPLYFLTLTKPLLQSDQLAIRTAHHQEFVHYNLRHLTK